MQNKMIQWVASFAVVLALGVVMLGAYTRLTDAGLGCPDWPGCYGHMVLPNVDTQLKVAQQHFPNVPIESKKAWTEMAHRYAAGILALLIFFIGFYVLYQRILGKKSFGCLPFILMLLVLFQAALGMWTVTLKLLPVVVMGHLLGGMLIFACLCCFRLHISALPIQNSPELRRWLYLGVFIVFVQIALGGWVSSNYAGIACIGLPTCNGLWWPNLHLAKGFYLFSPVGANYQGGLLDNDVRVTIQFIHRIGAMVTVLYLVPLSVVVFFRSTVYWLKALALLMLLVVLAQVTLGILNVLYMLPITVAVAHNGVAAILLATVLCMLHGTREGMRHGH
jgi:heme a synthase